MSKIWTISKKTIKFFNTLGVFLSLIGSIVVIGSSYTAKFSKNSSADGVGNQPNMIEQSETLPAAQSSLKRLNVTMSTLTTASAAASETCLRESGVAPSLGQIQ